MTRTIRRFAVAFAVLAMLTQTVGVLTASAQKVSNPSGPFTYTIHTGNLRIKDSPFNFDDQHTPECSDGKNNDEDFLGDTSQRQDAAVDYPADPQCTSPSDDSEVQPGFQPVLPVTVKGTVAADGTWTVNAPVDVFFPPSYAYAKNPVGSAFTVTVQIKGLGTWVGNLNPLTGAADLPMQMQVSIVGSNTIAATCHIGDPSGADTLIVQASSTKPSGALYDQSAGTLVMADHNFRVPPAKDCGSILGVSIADQISASFGIPTTDTDAVFTGDFPPAPNRPLRAITPQLAATAGPACRATTLNASASTASRPISSYGFDDTNDGTIDSTSASSSRSVVYTTSGSKTARVRVTDNQGDFSDATRTFTVPANLPPVAPNIDAPRSGAGAAVPFVLTGSDPEGGAVTQTVLISPVNGTLTGSPPNLTYQPNPGFTGVDVLTYKVSDDCTESSDTTGTVTFHVNRNPVADNQTVTTNQDIPVNFSLTGSDPDGDPLTYHRTSSPLHGALSGTDPDLQYVPDPGFFGLDSFTFTTDDGLNTSTPGVITLNVVKNTRPVADPQVVTTPEDTGTDITLTGSDDDGDTLAFTVVGGTGPTHGALTGTAPNLHYAPAANFNGNDSFQFQVNDGKGGINTATITIDVQSVNDVPVANDQAFNIQHDTSRSFVADVHDDDGDTLSYTPTTPVANGVVTGSFPNLTYTPSPGFIGVDTLVYSVNDGHGGIDTATVTFNVTATNQPPVAGSVTVNTNEDTAKAINLPASDPEGGPISIVVTANPAHGQLTGTAPALTYTPDHNYNGPDSFTYSVTDDHDQVSIGTISINVLAVNDLPVATPQTVDVTEDTAQTIILSATDDDDAALTYQVTSTPAHGTVTGSAPNVTYTPAPNYNGSDSFTFRARDPKGATSTATVTLHVLPVNDAPKAVSLSKTVAEDGSVNLTLSATDVDGDGLTYAVVAAPAHGAVTGGTGAARTYTPAANYNGFDTFTYTANDGTTNGNVATATISVTAVNDAPVANPQPVLHVLEDTPRAITLSASDVDGDALTLRVDVQPTHGKLTGTVPNLTYTPNADYNGTDSFKFSATDPKGAKGTVQIDLLVDPVPLIPTQMVASPSVANIGLLQVTYNNLKGTLTRIDNGQGVAGKTIDFYVLAKKVCSAVTDASGVATCKGSANTFVNKYDARFAGDADYAASAATGPVIK